MATAIPSELRRSLEVEYQVAMKYAIHATEINWQVGSVLIAGSLAAVGLSISAKLRVPTILVSMAAILAVITWFLFFRRNRDFTEIAAERMRVIEGQLGLVWGLETWLRASRKTAQGPTGMGAASFLAIGLIVVLSGLVVYLLFFPQSLVGCLLSQ